MILWPQAQLATQTPPTGMEWPSMAPYQCPNCAHVLHLEARICTACFFTLSYDPETDAFLFLGDKATSWRDRAGTTHDVRVCANNNEYEVCNWVVPVTDDQPFCRACRYNRMIPDLSGPQVPQRWGKIEAAKRRLIQQLIALRLPCETMAEAAAKGSFGLAFEFLYDPVGEESGNIQITTGHEAGLITLNILEADDAQREAMRNRLGEPYRTLLGHFRHEIGHYYWERLIEGDAERLAACRSLFGDDRISYEEMRQWHYSRDGSAAWTTDYVSAYAAMHPWEDFAETFAHLLHIKDALATIGGFGMRLARWPGKDMEPAIEFDAYTADTQTLIQEWEPFAFAENAVNRSMGLPDFYPFSLSDAIVKKLDFVNRLLADARLL